MTPSSKKMIFCLGFRASILLCYAVMVFAACSKKSEAPPAPVPMAAPTPTTAPASAPASAPNLAPPALNGNWSGDSGDPNLPVSFEVIDNQVTSMSASYSGKNGACSFNGSINSEGPALISGNSFVAKGKSPREEIYFTAKGTFKSATEASGTLEWKGTSSLCGPINLQYQWKAKKVPGDYGE